MEPPLTPMSRNTMRGLKTETDEKIRIQEEKIRLENIQHIVKNIYNIALQEARTTTNTSLQIDSENNRVLSGFNMRIGSEFFVKNMKEIISSLEKLFPGSSVRHFTIHGNVPKQKTFITIDWS
jgi:hypothetical protein